ncbi:hypothetical protein QJQ45_028244, partial [Haematococcus lacustris]
QLHGVLRDVIAMLRKDNRRRPCRTPTLKARNCIARSTNTSNDLVTYDEVQTAAKNRLGTTVRVIAPDDGTGNAGGGKLLAVTTGFVVPLLGILHCEALQVFTRGMKGEQGDQVRGGALGLGLVMGGAVFSHGARRGCKKAEILAIRDDDMTWKRLVCYYRFFGFEPVREVTGDLVADVPHLLVWGGPGTRMDADVVRMLARWSPALKRAARQGQIERDAQEQSELLQSHTQ